MNNNNNNDRSVVTGSYNEEEEEGAVVEAATTNGDQQRQQRQQLQQEDGASNVVEEIDDDEIGNHRANEDSIEVPVFDDGDEAAVAAKKKKRASLRRIFSAVGLPLEDEQTTEERELLLNSRGRRRSGGSTTASSSSRQETGEGQHGSSPVPTATILLGIIGPAFARKAQFWKSLLYSAGFLGVFLALVELAFFVAYTSLSEATWFTEEYNRALEYGAKSISPAALSSITEQQGGGTFPPDDVVDPSDLALLRLGGGHWWYVALLALGGLAVGIVKVAWTILPFTEAFPAKPPGFINDLYDLESHDMLLPVPMIVCSIISIGCGASVGPEASLGAAGTAAGTAIGRRWQIGSIKARRAVDNTSDGNTNNDDDDDSDPPSLLSRLLPDFSNDVKGCSLDGVVAAFGALLPSQYLSPLLLFELGSDWLFGRDGLFAFTEASVRAAVASSAAYALFTGLQERTILAATPVPFAAYDLLNSIEVQDLGYACVLGIISGLVGFIGFILIAIGAKLGNSAYIMMNVLGQELGLVYKEHDNLLGLLVPPVIGGALVGLLAVVSPLILSDGSEQAGAILTLADDLGPGNLIAAMFLKLFAVGLSLGFGFVGGQIFPLVFSGACLGAAAHLLVPAVPLLVAYPSCLVAVPCAFMPALFSFTTLASMSLALGGSGTAPIFVAVTASYTTVCGMGSVQKMLSKVPAQQ